MVRQLAFDLPLREARGREDFFVSPSNALALAAVEDRRGWPGGRMLVTGPAGSGKTHLAHVWAGEAGATLIAAGELAAADLPGLAAGPVAVEDAEGIAGDAAGETALFHLSNLMAERGHALLLTAARPVRDWGLGLRDLDSRMRAAGSVRLDAPDDALLSAVLLKLFADRQLDVSPALIGWLVPRMHRSLAHARDLVAALDAAALAEGRAPGRTLAARVMAELSSDGLP